MAVVVFMLYLGKIRAWCQPNATNEACESTNWTQENKGAGNNCYSSQHYIGCIRRAGCLLCFNNLRLKWDFSAL